MFIKEIKVRSSNQIKSSEKKNIIKEVVKQYPLVDEEKLKELIKVKESEINISKIVTHDGTDCQVYFCDRVPYFFKIDKDDLFIPTVYFLWRFPDILPKFYTHPEVFNRLINGADFMLPGVITNGPVTLYTFKHIRKNELCSLCLKGNEAPVAIGRAHHSGEDMYMSAMKGKCLNMLHIYRDKLWSLGDQSIPLPHILPTIQKPIQEESSPVTMNEASNEPAKTENDETTNQLSELNLEDKKIDLEEGGDEEDSKEEGAEGIDHEKIMTDAFLVAVKYKSKEFKLPIIVSTFVKIMQSSCPPNVQFDLKQTRFKKITTFLKEMESQGCIRTKEMQKGVLSITEIYKDKSDMIKYFKKPEWLKVQDEFEAQEKVESVFEVFELFKIDGNTEDIYKGKYKKGDVVSPSELRQFFSNYIKENNLQNPENPKQVKLTISLYRVYFKSVADMDSSLSFDTFYNTIFSKLSPMHQIKRVYSDKKERPDEQSTIIFKGKYQPVEFKLEQRGGNKKVTNIHNLSPFGIDPILLQSRLKKEIGSSVTINETGSAASSDFVLSIQGNQIYPIADFLKNEFGIQFKHMKGLELGVKNN